MSQETLKKPFINGLVESCIDPQVYQDVRRTFARESISILNHGNISITDTNPKLIARVQFTECEISPFHKHDIDCNDINEAEFKRLSSTSKFSTEKMAFKDIQNLLVNSFSPSKNGSRPYPSAGGLYPVEPLVFLFNDRIEGFENHPSGCYHFRAVSKKLQLINEFDIHHFYEKMLHGFAGKQMQHWPNFCVLYLAHITKAIFKYRYRGYRHAAMETGSMYQQATVVSQQMKMRTTAWSSFCEQQMLYELGLDHGLYMPLTMQLFGYGA